MTFLCERCKREIFKNEFCNYCGRKICSSCTKSAQTATKIVRLAICKDCWSDMKRRKAYKNKEKLLENPAIM
jgi:hypothetical protein